ncbi:hypothetical protein [Glycomyces xiaoerkulensis]|uniref:hypothetical protein n=1 Tax=Glycomyces xiaoerkulensis TaxID=2038139 RepID=UPI000C259B80|nr:hypothetical protein [Glycomyces xiaoerkulensis]
METYAILGLHLVNDEARSALPDAPVVEDRPSAFARLASGVAAARRGLFARHLRNPAAVPSPGEVRRAA